MKKVNTGIANILEATHGKGLTKRGKSEKHSGKIRAENDSENDSEKSGTTISGKGNKRNSYDAMAKSLAGT